LRRSRFAEGLRRWRGRVFNSDQLPEMAHERNRDSYERSIDIRISRLRRKIEAVSKSRR